MISSKSFLQHNIHSTYINLHPPEIYSHVEMSLQNLQILNLTYMYIMTLNLVAMHASWSPDVRSIHKITCSQSCQHLLPNPMDKVSYMYTRGAQHFNNFLLPEVFKKTNHMYFGPWYLLHDLHVHVDVYLSPKRLSYCILGQRYSRRIYTSHLNTILKNHWFGGLPFTLLEKPIK